MMENESITLLFCGVAGIALGLFFFIGLWWTVRKGLLSKNPALLFLTSQLLRTSSVIAGFYFLSQGHWQRLASALVGFLVAREVVKKMSQRFTHAA